MKQSILNLRMLSNTCFFVNLCILLNCSLLHQTQCKCLCHVIHLFKINLNHTMIIQSYRASSVYPCFKSLTLHGISKHVVCGTSKASDQPAHTRSLIRAFAGRLNILSLHMSKCHIVENHLS